MGILKFNSYAKQKSGEEYCSEVESYAQNMIESTEAESSITYPSKTEFATFRAPDYRITTETAYMLLPLPIYKITKILLKPKGLTLGGVPYEQYVNASGEPYTPDVTRFFLTNAETTALPDRPVGGNGVFGWNLAQSNTIPYEPLASKVLMSSAGAKRRPNQTDLPAYACMIISSFLNETLVRGYEHEGISITTALTMFFKESDLDSIDVRKWEFQIEYIPMTPATKIKAVKAEPMARQYTQIVNQRAEVSNAEAFGKYLHETAQKTGTEKIAIAKQYTKIADVPPVGALVTHKGERYRIVANSWNVTNTTMFTVTHLMSKNWSSKSKHIAVDQKYRNWDIPFDSYIWRTIYREEFICLSGERGDKDSGFIDTATDKAMWNFFTLTEEDLELKALFMMNGDQEPVADGVVLPVVAQGVGNSMVFSATMQDNMSAGLRIDAEDNEYCTDVIYCNADGTMMTCQVWLSTTIANYDASVFPEMKLTGGSANNVDGNQAFHETYYVDKDAGEALRFTIQAHFVPQAPWIVIGNKLAQDYPFVTSLSNKHKLKRKFKLWVLENYIRNGTDKLDESITITSGTNMNADCAELDKDFVKSYILVDVFDNSVSVSGLENIQGKLNGKAWAITDMDNNLYVGSNDISKKKIYFTWKHSNTTNAMDEDNEDIVIGGGGLINPDGSIVPGNPDTPDGPDEPDEPDTPDEPDVPEEPEEPDEPDVPEEPVVDTIEFSIGDTVCTAEKNMTWEAWALSGYCPDGIELELGTTKIMVSEAFSGEATTKYVSYNGSFVARTDGIVSGREYSLIENEIITFSINGIEFTAEEGMTWKGWLESDYSTQVAGGIVTMDGDERVFVKEEISGEENVYNFITLDGKFVVKTSQIINGEEYSFMTKEHEDNYVIAFYIRNRQFTAGVNMTWRQFIDSDEYYSAGLAYYINSNRVFVEKAISGVTTNNYVTYNGKFVPSMSEIVAGRSYNFNTIETDEPVPNGTLVAPDEPWQTVSDNAATATGTYVFDSGIHNIKDGYHRAEVSFTSNGKTFTSIATKWDSVAVTPTINIYYDDTLVYNGNTWEAEAYKTINFGGGAVVPKFVYDLLYNYASRKYSTNTLEYDLSFDGTYYVCKGFGGVDGAGAVGAINIAVPDSYLGKPVKYINDGVFRGKNMNVGTVTIGNNVERIGINAFNGSKLTAVTLGNGLKTIAEGAFEECDGLTSIVIPAGVESIGARAFYGCSKLTTVQVPSSVTYIGASTDENGVVYGAFGGCDRLATVIYGGTKDELAAICKDAVVTQTFNWGVTYECSDGTLIT